MHNVGVASLRDRCVQVAIEEDSFLVTPQFWDATGSWREFLEAKKCKWPSLERFINLRFSNEELSELHLCLHAHKLESKVASLQLGGAASQVHLSNELVDTDFVDRAHLADALSNWVASQALLKSMKETFGGKFGDSVPSEFTNLSEVPRVLGSSLCTEVKNKTEDFFRARKACRVKVFSSCGANLSANLLMKASPFSILLFQQSVVDTVLAELRSADKDPTVAFGKKSFPKNQVGSKRQKRKNTGGGSRQNKSFRKEQDGGKADQESKGGRRCKLGGKGKGKGKSSKPKPSTSSQ